MVRLRVQLFSMKHDRNMKKIILLLMLICCCSCSLVGTITTYNANGDVLKQYNNIIIDHANKPFGLNFYDKESKKFIIIGHAVPYTIEYEHKQYNQSTESAPDRDALIKIHDRLQLEINQITKMLRDYNPDTVEYNNIKHLMELKQNALAEVKRKLNNEFNHKIY